MANLDVLLLPTAPRGYTVEEMLADPLRLNATLGFYTNFCNLLGLSAIAVPAGFASTGLPFGVTLVGPAFADDALGPLAQAIHSRSRCGTGIDRSAVLPDLPGLPDDGRVEIAVVGAHLSGMALNFELEALDAQLVARTRTAPHYRLFVLPDTTPPKPGLVKSPDGRGASIAVEVWSMTNEAFGRFATAIASPLGIGKLELDDGTQVSGFLCEAWATRDAEEITSLGGWRAFVEAGMPAS